MRLDSALGTTRGRCTVASAGRVRRASVVTVAVLALTACGGSHRAATTTGAGSTQPGGSASQTASTGATTPTATRSASVPPAPTTAVPAPSAGNISQTVASAAITTQAPTGLAATAAFGTGVTVRVVSIASITANAQQPGEVTGPAAEVTLSMTNASTKAVSLTDVVVDLQDGAGIPSVSMSASPAAPFTGQLPAGQTAQAVYVFSLAAGHRNPVSIAVSYTVQAPVVRFVGIVK